MKPSEALRHILARPASEWEWSRTFAQVIGGSRQAVIHHAPYLFCPMGMRGLTVRMESLDGMRADYSAPWAISAMSGVCVTLSVEVESSYDGLLFRTRRVVAPDGRGGLPLPMPQSMMVEHDRYRFMRLMAEVSGTPGFDEAWAASGLTTVDMPWRGEVDETPPPRWTPVGRRPE
ncbi:hypothetical protein [Falsiroseomonas tokyonensis]|uniref:Uncharacterized protein n=1 Tax=Falsiroseomonas tokyonensis TaxID=430521 RepID=A0ABV7BSW9_9PROT|nr:hypothetical protein [Falsiroseomonas tokyonensis]MBU8538733.1 hypothetical protein [Falsiroseomonas tokyonensis]